MRKLTLSCVLLVGLAGCWNNMSNDDLIFLAGVPTAKEVELTVEDSQTHASALTYDEVGEDAGIYFDAARTATNVNTGVGDILAFVDSLGRGFPATERTDDARIWGPFANVDGSGRTIRFEIRREVLEDQQPRFHYCIQFAFDHEVTGDAHRCGEADANGFVTVLGGFFDPKGDEGGARSGSGELQLDLDAAQRLGIAEPGDKGIITLTYDFSRGGEAKTIDVNIVIGLSTATTPTTLEYHYDRDLDGHIEYRFALANVPPDPSRPGQNPGSWEIDAAWDEGGPGRGDGIGRGGDLQPGQHATVTQCWDASHKVVYEYFAIWQGATEVLKWELPIGGDPAILCPF